MKRNRCDEDDVVNAFYENYRRAGLSLLVAAGLFVAWLAVWWIGPEHPSQAGTVFNSLVRTVVGWGTTIFAGLAFVQYAYAFLYPRLISARS